ncbi:group III truncated hemoglobin [Paucibacter sp. DJ2R-2]|uniref:group III truncated hemoglobin n=1 Tax=Paucibacter sp. DJ2R-2 TaxID=2893558 RepID=UPI0021E4E8A8|nr:group III truncated hemoglobin [Paucibacter sp. DJ2R-2]MCV2438679.1 group III truncated hemoglobin [Paucibacter sp. DJ2R-2]
MADLHSAQGGSVNRTTLRRLVDAFYVDVRRDELLGPVFEASIPADAWEVHLERMTDFWSTVMLGTRSFRGNVFKKHVALADIADVRPEHFLRWITLWNHHSSALFPAEVAQELQETAKGIGRNLFYGFFQQFARFVVVDGKAVGYEAI